MKIGRFTAVFKQSRQDGRANRDNAANRKKQRKDTKFNAMGTEVKLKTYPRSRSYKVRTKFVFEGTFEVKADSRQMAIQIVKSQCGMSMGQIHTCCADVTDWDFGCNPTQIVKR